MNNLLKLPKILEKKKLMYQKNCPLFVEMILQAWILLLKF